VLISEGSIRQQRRALNEAALDTGSDLHRLASSFVDVISEEARGVVVDAAASRHLGSAQFMKAWWRVVRRIVLGTGRGRTRRSRMTCCGCERPATGHFCRCRTIGCARSSLSSSTTYVEDAEPGTLASAVAETPAGGAVDPVGQMPQWLFAFDTAGMAILRVLALLATHPDQLARAFDATAEPERASLRRYLRGCVLESVRLWPTTPTILRDTTEDTQWRNGRIAKGAGLMIVAPAFHRDDELLPFAHDFVPEIWLDGRAQQYPQLVPFSAGPAECPGRNLVLFSTSTMLANLLNALDFRLTSTPRPSPGERLPMTLNQLTLDFAVRPVSQTTAVRV
jgi:hypothetical protein